MPASASVETTRLVGSARRCEERRRAVAARRSSSLLLLALGFGLGLEQGLTVGDRDLVVIGMDFAEGEEPVAISAVFHEGRLKRRLDPGDLREIDIPAQLLPVSGFEVEFFDLLTTHHHDPGFFRVGGIDEHLVCHVELSTWRSRAGPEAGAALRAVGHAARKAAGWNCVRIAVDRHHAPQRGAFWVESGRHRGRMRWCQGEREKKRAIRTVQKRKSGLTSRAQPFKTALS